jgi:hypothetical protein
VKVLAGEVDTSFLSIGIHVMILVADIDYESAIPYIAVPAVELHAIIAQHAHTAWRTVIDTAEQRRRTS